MNTLNKTPSKIKLHKKTQQLELVFGNQNYHLSAEFLRVHSPSAEVKGHAPGQEILQLNKQDVEIRNIEAVGHYAIKPIFSDGHDSGIFTWPYLADLCERYEILWQEYLAKCKASKKQIEKENEAKITSTVKWVDPS